MARPFWSGHIQISLVSFGVKLFPAVEAKSEIHFHQINRKTGERIRHQNVSAPDEKPVENDEIVKGYEYSKGEYLSLIHICGTMGLITRRQLCAGETMICGGDVCSAEYRLEGENICFRKSQ